MSLFTVIKYGNTDLGSLEELYNLPGELINEYYFAILDIHASIVESRGSRTYYVASNYSWLTQEGQNRYRAAFMKVLLEHEPEQELL
jgi:hypothetical protein